MGKPKRCSLGFARARYFQRFLLDRDPHYKRLQIEMYAVTIVYENCIRELFRKHHFNPKFYESKMLIEEEKAIREMCNYDMDYHK